MREPHEYQICRIPGREADPARRAAASACDELDPADEIVVHCKSGVRSAKAVDFLKQAGLPQGPQHERRHPGLGDKVDPSVPKY